jgi:hypothetical protein
MGNENCDLDQDIKQVRATAYRLERARSPFERKAAAAALRLSHLKFRRWLRAPAQFYELWKVGVLVIGSTVGAIAGAIWLVATFRSDSFLTASLGLAIGAAFSAGVLYQLLYYPSDVELTQRIVEAENETHAVDAQLSNLQATDGLAGVEQQLRKLLDRRLELTEKLREDIASGKRQREALLQRNWKAMRDTEWEEYLVEVESAAPAIKDVTS